VLCADWTFGSCAGRSTSSASALIDTRSWIGGTRDDTWCIKRQGKVWLVLRRHGDPPASATDPPAVRNPRRFTSQFPPKPVAPRHSLPAGISEPVPTSKKASIWLAMPSWPPTIAAWPGPAAPRHLADGLGQHRLFGRVLSQRLRLYLLRHVVQCRCHQATGGTVIEIDPGLANVPRPHPRAGTDDRPDRQLSCGAGMCPGDQRHTPMVAMTPAGPEPSGRAPWRSWTEAAVITTSRISLVVSTAMCRLRQLTFLALSEPRLG